MEMEKKSHNEIFRLHPFYKGIKEEKGCPPLSSLVIPSGNSLPNAHLSFITQGALCIVTFFFEI
jgi:hypothetical protein